MNRARLALLLSGLSLLVLVGAAAASAPAGSRTTDPYPPAPRAVLGTVAPQTVRDGGRSW